VAGTCAEVVRRREIKEREWNQIHARLEFHLAKWSPYLPVVDWREEVEASRAIVRPVPGGESRRRDWDQCCSRVEGLKS
jgi:hypothetical protein